MTREKKTSNSVKKGVVAGGSVAVVLGWIAGAIHAKNPTIPLEVIVSGIGVIVSGVQALVSRFARGGRKGETE